MSEGPFFQYVIRAFQAGKNSALLEQRDRELEDYLSQEYTVSRDSNRDKARGVVPGGYAQITANTAAVGAVTDVTGLSVTFTATATRRYRTSIICGQFASVAGDSLAVLISDGAGTQLQRHTFLVPVAGCETAVSTQVVETGLTGSVTRKVQHQRLSGGGNSTVTAAATYPASITVEDIGPA